MIWLLIHPYQINLIIISQKNLLNIFVHMFWEKKMTPQYIYNYNFDTPPIQEHNSPPKIFQPPHLLNNDYSPYLMSARKSVSYRSPPWFIVICIAIFSINATTVSRHRLKTWIIRWCIFFSLSILMIELVYVY